MTRLQIALLPVFGAAAMVLRFFQMQNGFDADGLALRGYAVGMILPAVLLAAALFYLISSWKLSERSGGFAGNFRIDGAAGLVFGAAGAFLILASSALSAVYAAGDTLTLLLAAFGCASALCLLAVLLCLYKSRGVPGIALLVPVCCLTLRLIFLYRTDAADPVLARTYVELLTFAALTLAHLLRASFAFGSGAPRLYLPVSAMAVILGLAAETESPALPTLLLYAGFVLVELAFLLGADFERRTA